MSIPNPGSPVQAGSAERMQVAARSAARRMAWMQWIRRTHGWFGLWGAILGLIFGTAGIWLNHRAVMKFPVSQERINAQLALPEPPPASAQEMAAWLQSALQLPGPPKSMRVEASRPVPWVDKGRRVNPDDANREEGAATRPLMQPERWVFSFGGPSSTVQVDYWRGNRSVGVTTTRNGFIATLTNLHKGVGMPVAWILLVDTLAGSLIFLSVSGVALWMLTHRRRRVGLVIFGSSVLLTLGLIAAQF